MLIYLFFIHGYFNLVFKIFFPSFSLIMLVMG